MLARSRNSKYVETWDFYECVTVRTDSPWETMRVIRLCLVFHQCCSHNFWISQFSCLQLNPSRIGCLWWYKILPCLPRTHCHAQKCCFTCCVDSSWKPKCQQNSVSWFCKQKLFILLERQDCFHGDSRAVFTVIDQIAQTLFITQMYLTGTIRPKPWSSLSDLVNDSDSGVSTKVASIS